MMRHRSGPPPSQESSSSDEEDAFSALSKKRKRKSAAAEKNEGKSSDADQSVKEPTEDKPIVPSQTSSNKRHHGVLSDSRKAKMDALLEELADSAVQSRTEEPRRRGGSQDIRKKGSFVEPGEEHLTTNIFVGNLAPSITEEQMTELFQQFGTRRVMWMNCGRINGVLDG
jgi:U2-associated protein SR140